jgi:hypothetical protein
MPFEDAILTYERVFSVSEYYDDRRQTPDGRTLSMSCAQLSCTQEYQSTENMTRYRSIAHILTLLVVLSGVAFASDAEVQQISIKSRWSGLGKPSTTELLIQNDRGTYRLDGAEVAATTVNIFLASVREPVIPKPSLVNLGLTKPWLESNAIAIIRDARAKEGEDSTYWKIGGGTPEQKSLFRRSYTDPAFVGRVLPELFCCRHTDDYPGVTVTITFTDGSTTVVSSVSQSEFMLPWKLQRNSTTSETFNSDISTALLNLMPKGATNRERISGDGFSIHLAEAVMSDIEEQWKLLGAEDKDSNALSRIRSTYTVVTADVNSNHDVTFGVYSQKNGGEEENLHVLVRKPTFPKGFSENVILLYRNGRTNGVDGFLNGASRYEQLVLSVPWLSRLRTKNPDRATTLLWVHDLSFSDKAMKQFAADMHVLRKDGLAKEVRTVQHDVAVLNVSYGDWWLVLPDKRMVLWRYETVSGLLGFKKSDFSVHECTDYQGVTGGCVGAVVSPEGEIAR